MLQNNDCLGLVESFFTVSTIAFKKKSLISIKFKVNCGWTEKLIVTLSGAKTVLDYSRIKATPNPKYINSHKHKISFKFVMETTSKIYIPKFLM